MSFSDWERNYHTSELDQGRLLLLAEVAFFEGGFRLVTTYLAHHE